MNKNLDRKICLSNKSIPANRSTAKVGCTLTVDQRKELYRLCNTPWKDKKPWIRVLELKRFLQETPVMENLVEWVRDYSDQRRVFKRIEDPAVLVARACRKAKDSVAAGYPIAEAISYCTADAVYRHKPITNFEKVKHDIRKVVERALDSR